MVSSTVDRRLGLTGGAAIKAPCRCATTAAITLSGLQTIDGTLVSSGDRILVKDQGTTSANGVYVADTGTWVRDLDFDGTNDVRRGSLVMVTSGTQNANKLFRLEATDPITVGVTDITFVEFVSNVTISTNSTDFVIYDSDPVLSNSFTDVCPGGIASVSGTQIAFDAFNVTLAANMLRRYYINNAGVITYDEVPVLNYSSVTRRNPGLVFLYQVSSDASKISAILPMSNTFPVDKHSSMVRGSIDHFVEIFYLYDVTTPWSAHLTVTYGELLLTSTGNVYQVTTPGETSGTEPTALTDYDINGKATGYVVDGTATLVYYCIDSYLGAFRYAQNNGVEWYFDAIGLEEVIHMKLRSGSPLGPGADTTLASLVKKHILSAFKHLVANWYSGGTYLRGQKMIVDGWIWECTVAGTVAAANTAFTAATPHSLGQLVTSGSATFKVIYQSFGSQEWFWLNVDNTFLVYRYPDSHDSYCSTFFSLIARYIQYTDDWAWLNDTAPQPSMTTYKSILDILIYTNLDTQLANFLSKSFQGDIAPWDGSAFTTQYFEDNCETVKGYTDAAYVYDKLGDATRNANCIANSSYVGGGVYALYNTTYNLVAWYYGNDVSTWATLTDLQFYPYIQAQFYAEKCGLSEFTEDQYYAQRQAAFALYPNWITDRGKDSFPNNFIGLIAARYWQDPVIAYSFVDQSERYHLKRGALIISEYACYLRIKEYLMGKG